MKKYFKNISIFLLVFIASFLAIHILGFANGYGDPINSYGFAKAISMGQIPYLEFNTISTPLYAMYQSLFLHIYDDFIMINISQALVTAASIILIYKLFGKKTLLLLLIVSIFQFRNMIPTYNSFSLFFVILLMYMEKKHPDKDFLIGILIALGIMAKQTVGCFMIIPSIILYHKKLKKLGMRFLGFLIPCFVFLIYLLVNGALYKFFDLCLFGMFDFLNNNGVGGGHINVSWIIISLIAFIIGIILIFKNRKETNNYYLIWGILFAFPLFDITHVCFWLTCFVMMIMPFIKNNIKPILVISLAVAITYTVLYSIFWTFKLDLCISKDFNHFKYNLHRKITYDNIIKMNDYVNTFDNPVVVGYFSMTHTIMNDRKLSYFDILYDGNYGYNGINKMKKMIDKMHDQIFVVSMNDYNNDDEFSQFSKELAKYIMDNSKKIDSKHGFDVYYKE